MDSRFVLPIPVAARTEPRATDERDCDNENSTASKCENYLRRGQGFTAAFPTAMPAW